jgi:hypothetical protein
MENSHILDGVDDDLGDKFIWQQQHQAHRGGHQGDGGKSTATGFGVLMVTRVEVGGNEG